MSIADMLIPPQAGTVIKSLGGLMGCSQGNPMSLPQDNQYSAGQQACYISGSEAIPIKIVKDVRPNDFVAVVRLPNGQQTVVSVDYIVDSAMCQ